MTELKKDAGGVVRISDEVLSMLAGNAAMEAEGVVSLYGITGYFKTGAAPRAVRKQLAKGINVTVANQIVAVSLAITVKLSAKLHEVAKDVQDKIKTSIETMTGLTVAEVNVNVAAVVGPNKKSNK